ncbi:MAG: TldD/PmbA family protein [Anaerolineae bacterium]
MSSQPFVGASGLERIAHSVMAASEADQTEVVLWAQDSRLTRFANSSIHQNVAEREVEVRVRAVLGKRVGVATTNDLSEQALRRVAETACRLARLQPENPDFLSLPEPQPIPDLVALDETTVNFTPDDRARGVALICRIAGEDRLQAFGAYSTAVQELAVFNSPGVSAYFPTTSAHLTLVLMGEGTSGYAEAASWKVRDLDVEALTREAVDRARRARAPRELPPGEYPAILEAYAVADLLGTLGYVGWGALALQEGRSFVAGRLGERVAAPIVSVWDDGLDLSGLPMPFDFEGVPKQRVDLLAQGVASGVVYDSYTAGREPGKRSTGHALPAPNRYGPLPTNLFMAPGEATLEEMIQNTARGVLVTRFHYTVPVHPQKTVTTGMTRDGTFWIEGGEIAYPVKNLRFTQSYLDVLAHAEQVGRETRLVSDYLGGTRAPALKARVFNFTGVTEF